MEKRLYETLKSVARVGGTIHYQELADILDQPYGNIAERDAFHKKLGDLSIDEHENGRPMISVLVVVKQQRRSDEMPGNGFFKLAMELGLWDGKDREKFFITELTRTYTYWKLH